MEAPTSLEIALLFNVAVATMLLQFTQVGQLEPLVARRMFKVFNLVVLSMLGSTGLSWSSLGRFALATFGVQTVNGVLQTLAQRSVAVGVDGGKRVQ